jgi:hypothetical protein
VWLGNAELERGCSAAGLDKFKALSTGCLTFEPRSEPGASRIRSSSATAMFCNYQVKIQISPMSSLAVENNIFCSWGHI